MWRCFFSATFSEVSTAICSTHVEMFLISVAQAVNSGNLLHACGDVSSLHCVKSSPYRSAPRMWRCFRACSPPLPYSGICSTHVEMFLLILATFLLAGYLLHACGDVSDAQYADDARRESAPRMWRCFHFCWNHPLLEVICSTHVEMFLLTRPR